MLMLAGGADRFSCSRATRSQGRLKSAQPDFCILIESAFEAVICGTLASRTVTVKLYVPIAAGVPKIEPNVVLIAKPGGRPLETDQV